MTSKKAKQKSAGDSGKINNLLILVVIILTFILVFSAIRTGDIKPLNAVESSSGNQQEVSAKAEVTSISEESDLDQRIRDFIMNNPEVILDSVSNYQNEQARERENDKVKNLLEVYDDLIADLPSAGPEDAENEIIEFYDYNCGYCKQVVPVVNKVLADRGDTKVYFVDFPILGKSSEDLAKVSSAAFLVDSDRFLEVHNLLMKLGRSGISKAIDELVKIGFDKKALEAKVNSDEVAELLEKNREFANKIRISGTPTFIVNKEFFGGALSEAAINEALGD